VAEGEMFGLLGPNGAGKTTTLSILSCLLAPTAGEVRLLGRPVRLGDKEARRLIGIVPQELAIYGELTARENLIFFGELYGLHGAELHRRVENILAAVALQDRADDRAESFSGGMKRRLNLGASLIHQPRLLLLDEPTTGVDPQSRNHIFEEVRRLNADGLTVIYTSHYMEEVQALCSRIGIIDHGKLIACDTLTGLLQTLGGLIRFRVPQITPALRDRLKQLAGDRLSEKDEHVTANPQAPARQLADCRLTEIDEQTLELECRDVKASLLQLVAALNELQLELTHLETQEPNLERVFLHLTGHALRD
jgi:ABC-2 type transport system ATP-binding protein